MDKKSVGGFALFILIAASFVAFTKIAQYYPRPNTSSLDNALDSLTYKGDQHYRSYQALDSLAREKGFDIALMGTDSTIITDLSSIVILEHGTQKKLLEGSN